MSVCAFEWWVSSLEIIAWLTFTYSDLALSYSNDTLNVYVCTMVIVDFVKPGAMSCGMLYAHFHFDNQGTVLYIRYLSFSDLSIMVESMYRFLQIITFM